MRNRRKRAVYFNRAMMKTLLLTVICFFSGLTTIGQFHPPVKDVAVEYDRFKDQTLVSFIDTYATPELAVGFIYDGKKLTADARFFAFTFSGKCRSVCFNGSVDLLVIVDGGKPIKAGRKENAFGDSVTLAVYRDKFQAIAEAKESVEYQVGRYEGKWTESDIAVFKKLWALGTALK